MARQTPLDKKLQASVQTLLRKASIASVRSWLKARKKASSAGSREQLIDRVTRLLQESALTFAELEDGIIGIEEAGGKRILLFEIQGDLSPDKVRSRLSKAGITPQEKREMAPVRVNPFRVYTVVHNSVLRIKWTEMHYKPVNKVDADGRVHTKIVDVSKIILLVVDIASKTAEIRFDRPEISHPHRSGALNWKDAYYSYYVSEAEKLLDVTFVKSELANALKSIIQVNPSPVRLQVDGHVNRYNVAFKVSARHGDIRDDKEWKAMYATGGKDWAHDQQHFYWRAEESKGLLSRDVYSHVDALAGALRVEADCWDAEVDYAVKKVREFQ